MSYDPAQIAERQELIERLRAYDPKLTQALLDPAMYATSSGNINKEALARELGIRHERVTARLSALRDVGAVVAA